jgi:hypothetical protein
LWAEEEYHVFHKNLVNYLTSNYLKKMHAGFHTNGPKIHIVKEPLNAEPDLILWAYREHRLVTLGTNNFVIIKLLQLHEAKQLDAG